MWRRPRHLRFVTSASATGRRGASVRRDDDGFTLLELVIVVAILPIIVGAVGAGLIAIFSIQGSISSRLSDSGDAQVVSANFVEDVQSSLQITTDAAASQCGPGKQLLGLEWNLSPTTNTYLTVVSYNEVKSGAQYLLRRYYCTQRRRRDAVGGQDDLLRHRASSRPGRPSHPASRTPSPRVGGSRPSRSRT